MTSQDDRLQKYFEEERRRDRAATPSFHDLVGAKSDGPSEARSDLRSIDRWPLRSLAAAAVVTIGLGLWHFIGDASEASRPEPQEVASVDEVSDEAATSTDLDSLCDAVLAALDEHDQEFRMSSSTDALLASFDSDSR